jgi:hypothetical protein
MLDLETWGTKPGSALRSIGIVQFDPRTAGFGMEMYCNLDLEDQLKYGATQDKSTVDWWARQSEEAQAALMENQLPLKEAVHKVCEFFRKSRCQFVWAQGSNFDPVLLEHTMSFINVNPPWRFYNTRDTRTAYGIAGYDTKRMPRQGTYHNALDDAKHQVRCVYKSYELLHGKSE